MGGQRKYRSNKVRLVKIGPPWQRTVDEGADGELSEAGEVLEWYSREALTLMP